MITTPVSALAAEHIRDLQAEAARERLGALARRCRPARWRLTARLRPAC